MGYDIIDESQPLPAEPPTTCHQASTAFVHPTGYDEVEPIETTRSRVRSIFSGSSNHSGRSRASDKGQKPFIEGTHLGGGPASTKGSDLHSEANLHVSIGVGLAPAKSPVPRSGGFATAAGVNQRLTQELSEQRRAFTLESDEVKSIRAILETTLEESKKHSGNVDALKLQLNSITEAKNMSQDEVKFMINDRDERIVLHKHDETQAEARYIKLKAESAQETLSALQSQAQDGHASVQELEVHAQRRANEAFDAFAALAGQQVSLLAQMASNKEEIMQEVLKEWESNLDLFEKRIDELTYALQEARDQNTVLQQGVGSHEHEHGDVMYQFSLSEARVHQLQDVIGRRDIVFAALYQAERKNAQELTTLRAVLATREAVLPLSGGSASTLPVMQQSLEVKPPFVIGGGFASAPPLPKFTAKSRLAQTL